MGEAELCPSCGWTYKPSRESKPSATGSGNPVTKTVPDDFPAATPAEYTLPRYPQHVWWEVAAVAAVSFVPYLIALPYHFYHPTPPPPYWLDTFHSFALNCCTVLVVLYLIGRSGESWERFGVTSPKAADVFIGAALLLTAVVLSGILSAFTRGSSGSEMFVPPRSDLDYVLMFPKFASIGFTEELVMRCYLITRLSGLLRSRGKAVCFIPRIPGLIRGSLHVRVRSCVRRGLPGNPKSVAARNRARDVQHPGRIDGRVKK
jgi:hypothetical protein